MRIAGLVILYRPNISILENIKTYLPFLDKLIVFDNTELADKYLHNVLLSLEKITLVHDCENRGIAKRLNEGVNMCIKENFSWLLTMDQDSFFEGLMFSDYLNCLKLLKDNYIVAMTGIEYEKVPAKIGCDYQTTQQLITSGSIINVEAYKTIGGFDEALFIDDVDTDYCYNAIKSGFQIIKFTNIFLNHSLGNVSYHKSLKTFKTSSRTLHSSVRLYYMVRNFFYINEKFPQHIFKEERKRRKKDLIHRIKNNFLYGTDKLTLLRFVILGWWDFRRKRMGKKI